jgi:hypothetical protein
MAVLIMFFGIGSGLVSMAGYAFQAVREVENVLPDHDADVMVSAQT